MAQPGKNAIRYATVNASSIGDAVIVAAPTDTTKQIVVLSYTVVLGGIVGVTWKSAANVKSGLIKPGAAAVIDANGAPTVPCFECNAGEALNLNLDAAIQVGGHVTYMLAP